MTAQNEISGFRTPTGESASLPNYNTSRDYIQHVVYDTVPFQSTSGTKADRFFSTPINQTQNGLAKGEVHTNMQDSGKLPAGQNFKASAISFAFVFPTALRTPAAMQALDTLMRQSRFRLVAGSRSFTIEAHGSLFVQSKALFTAGVATFPVVIGQENAPYAYDLGIEVPLVGPSNVPLNFYVEHLLDDKFTDLATVVTGDNDPTKAVWRICRLHGLLERP